MARARDIPREIFKDTESLDRYSCIDCSSLLRDPVQLGCGHRMCRQCADQLIDNAETTPQCPECDDEIDEEDGVKYFPDRFVKREILNLTVVCIFSHLGCNWEGKYEHYQQHIDNCQFVTSTCQHCGEKIRKYEMNAHSQSCHLTPVQCLLASLSTCQHYEEKSQLKAHSQMFPKAPKECPLSVLGCTIPSNTSDNLQQHMGESATEHLKILAKKMQALEDRIKQREYADNELKEKTTRKDFVEADGAMHFSQHYDSGIDNSLHSMAPQSQRKTQLVARVQSREEPSSAPQGSEYSIHMIIESMLTERMTRMQEEMRRSSMAEMRLRDEEIAELKTTIKKLERTIQSKSAELEDRDFRLSLIEYCNHDGAMIWKIPQFSQRKADAENGKYTSIFSLPFYSGRYGYKMCLRLYIMGDGIGKGTHLSLFFVVMCGEFDNILQWPFTHKVTFKLINQAGGRDIVDTFQPDPMSSSFQKPKSDMNIASGCPHFVSHTELERGGFVVDDTIIIKCAIYM